MYAPASSKRPRSEFGLLFSSLPLSSLPAHPFFAVPLVYELNQQVVAGPNCVPPSAPPAPSPPRPPVGAGMLAFTQAGQGRVTSRIMCVPTRTQAAIASFAFFGDLAGGGRRATLYNYNEALTTPLSQLADLLELDKKDAYRSRGFSFAAEFLRRLPVRIESKEHIVFVISTMPERVAKRARIGESVLNAIHEILSQGKLDRLRTKLNDEEVKARKLLTTVWGIGPAKARLLAAPPFNVRDLSGLAALLESTPGGKLKGRLGGRERTIVDEETAGILKFHDEMQVRIPRSEVEEIAAVIKAAAEAEWGVGCVLVEAVGSYRRGASDSGDADVIITHATDRNRMLPIADLKKHLPPAFVQMELRCHLQGADRGKAIGCRGGSTLKSHPTLPYPIPPDYNLDVKDKKREGASEAVPYVQDLARTIAEATRSLQCVSRGEVPGMVGGLDLPVRRGPPPKPVTGGQAARRAVVEQPDSHEATGWKSWSELMVGQGGGPGDDGARQAVDKAFSAAVYPPVIDFSKVAWLDKHEYPNEMWMGIVRLGPGRVARRLDIKAYPRTVMAFALLAFTGSDYFNRSLRLWAHKAGWTLSDQGLRPALRDGEGKRPWDGLSIACDTEADVFAAMGVPYRAPHERDAQLLEVAVGAGGKPVGGGGGDAPEEGVEEFLALETGVGGGGGEEGGVDEV